MQLDSQMSFNSYGNVGYEAETSKPEQFDSNDDAMEIDNYEELKDQIRAEVFNVLYNLFCRYWRLENSCAAMQNSLA